MGTENFYESLKEYFQNNVLYSESFEEINPDESLIDSGYVDSIGIIGLVAFIEKTFNFKVDDNEIIPENFNSLNNIHMYIKNKTENCVLQD